MAPWFEQLRTLAAARGWSDHDLDDVARILEEAVASATSGRYQDQGPIGAGGMGEVRRVLDPVLLRTLAMKVIHPRLQDHPGALARFVEEAQVAAQLAHAGIVPVHELGTLQDGRRYFTMPEVRGRTFTELIREVHRVSAGDRWEATADGWTLRRLIEVLRRACETVAYAHARGVVHRDLKPDNVLVGAYGEVLVVDWGLAKVLSGREHPMVDVVETERSADAARATQLGTVLGSPAYMPPEQARGEVDRVDARSDVYALGATLYEVLSDRAPYDGADARTVVRQVIAGPPPPPGPRAKVGATLFLGFDDEPASAPEPTRELPADLVAICTRAMERDPDRRYPEAGAMAAVEEARRLIPEAAKQRALAEVLQQEAADLARGVETWAPEEQKLPAWERERSAAIVRRQAAVREVQAERMLHSALTHDPNLLEAHVLLAERWRTEHAAAEQARDEVATSRAEFLLRDHVAALPESHPERIRHLAWLRGTGALTLLTDPPGAEVELYRYVEQRRRKVAVREGSLGRTPLERVPLAMGSWLLVLRAEGRAPVRYPVSIRRQEHWDGVPPGASEPFPIVLPAAGELGRDDCYVPGGWFACGGDPQAPLSLPAARLWVEPFVMRRHPVTNAEFVAFLDGLVAEGRADEALAYAPRERGGTDDEGAMIYHFDGRRFALVPDADGTLWQPDWPVVQVDAAGAEAYCAWAAARERDRLCWRLPTEIEWEKAARGTDGRYYPFGDFLDPTWCHVSGSRQTRLPSAVGEFATDESPYQVRGLGGNVRDLCADRWRDDPRLDPGARYGPPAEPAPADAARTVRGGLWTSSPHFARAANRGRSPGTLRQGSMGFRLARSLQKTRTNPVSPQ